MQIDYWEYLYENWFIFFGVMTTLIIILTIVIIKVIVSRIQTKVWYFQKNSVDEYKAKEKGTLIWFNKMSVSRKADPYMIKKAFNIHRIFLVQQNRKETLDFRKIKANPDKDKIMWEAVIETQAISQTIRGLLETTRTLLIYLGAGAFIGFLISQVLFVMGG